MDIHKHTWTYGETAQNVHYLPAKDEYNKYTQIVLTRALNCAKCQSSEIAPSQRRSLFTFKNESPMSGQPLSFK